MADKDVDLIASEQDAQDGMLADSSGADSGNDKLQGIRDYFQDQKASVAGGSDEKSDPLDFDDPSVIPLVFDTADDTDAGTDDAHVGDETSGHEDGGETVSQLDDELMARAVLAGVPLAEARELGDSLETVLERIESRKETKPTKEGDTQDDAFKFELDPEQYDPTMVKQFQDFASTMQQQMAALKKQNNELSSMVERQRHETRQEQYDAVFTKLGDGYQELVGNGSDLDRKHAKARQSIVAEAETIAQVRQNMGQPRLSEADLIRRAIQNQHPDFVKQLVRNEYEGKVKKRRGQFTERPTQKKAAKDTRSPAQRAIEAVASYQREHGGHGKVTNNPDVFR